MKIFGGGDPAKKEAAARAKRVKAAAAAAAKQAKQAKRRGSGKGEWHGTQSPPSWASRMLVPASHTVCRCVSLRNLLSTTLVEAAAHCVRDPSHPPLMLLSLLHA